MDDNGARLLTAQQLYRTADLGGLAFATTRDLEPSATLVGQKRAQSAIRLGSEVAAEGFNIFAAGESGTRLSHLVRRILGQKQAGPKLFDWAYVNNFATPQQPLVISLPPGRAPEMQAAVRKLVDDLRITLPTLFESEDYQRRRRAIDETLHGKTQKAFNAVGERAAKRGVAIVRTPMGFTTAPMENGSVVELEAFNAWPEQRRREVQQAIHEVDREIEETLRAMPGFEKERREAIRALDQETARFAFAQEIEEARARLADMPAALAHLDALSADLTDNIELFLQRPEGAGDGRPSLPLEVLLGRYDVNVLASHVDCPGSAPVVEELHPTLGNLLGRVEHTQVQGALVTNFRMIRAGSLHRANGGTILIDARSLLGEPYTWAALKRALVQRRIVIEDLAHIVGFASTAALEPAPIPLDVKVVLFGERHLYYLLASFDPEFERHFKILADFDDDIERSPENEGDFTRLIAAMAGQAKLRPLERDAVALIVEQAARLAGDSGRLSLQVESVRDLITEADHCAGSEGRDTIARADVERTVRERRSRAARIEERGLDMILRDVALIATDGQRVGQINGLSVSTLANHAFGRPTRITARVRPGSGRIVDIERETKLGGPLHSKGVLILAGFVAGRYALDGPMSLFASLVFEQSYGGIEGDSASAAELCALLSALAEQPLRQDLAITGSINQHGDVQPIGGVNEKIEGFYDVCAARGLTGRQGVLIPESNVQHLMLREDVVEACREGRFAVRAVSTIDQALTLLTGKPAGRRGNDGAYPEDSINRAVEDCLRSYAKVSRRSAADAATETKE